MENKTKSNILYVEDDITLSYITKENLERRGYNITLCNKGDDALDIFENNTFDICLLDVMLPGVDGFEISKTIRKKDFEIPIIFITAKSLQEDKIQGLLLGGDDYIIKPFSMEELVLKIEIFLSRCKKQNHTNPFQTYRLGEFVFDFTTLCLQKNDSKFRLTYREGELLKFFIENKNKLITREQILFTLWKDNDYFMGRSMDVFISRLRKYLKSDNSIKIENIHGVGFIFRET